MTLRNMHTHDLLMKCKINNLPLIIVVADFQLEKETKKLIKSA